MSELKQDKEILYNDNLYINENEKWYYINKGNKYPAKKRVCTKCGKIEIVRNITKTDLCLSCALTGIPKSEEHKNKIKAAGEKRGNGISYSSQGYKLLMRKDHPNANGYGYVLEHRLIMEEMLGRYLLPEEIVHHIDDDKSNNKPSNLWLFENKAAHMSFHNKMRTNTKKSNYIYLGGNISQDIKTYEWREDIDQLLKEERLYHKVVIVNPCANKYNQEMRNVGNNGLDFIKEVKNRSQNLLRSKDYQLISMCNLMIVDLVTSTDTKPLIGTLHEICWAKDIFKIPIIGITHNMDTPYTNHPWITECCSAKVNTIEEAAQIVKTFFLEY